MNENQVIGRITEILNESKIGVLSTAHDNIPNARYMWFYNDGLTLYAKTSDKSKKYDELEDNPKAHILLGFNDSSDHAFVEIFGEVEKLNDQALIDSLWEKKDKDFFNSKENPNLKILKISPKNIKIKNDEDYEEAVLTL